MQSMQLMGACQRADRTVTLHTPGLLTQAELGNTCRTKTATAARSPQLVHAAHFLVAASRPQELFCLLSPKPLPFWKLAGHAPNHSVFGNMPSCEPVRVLPAARVRTCPAGEP
jgi:hypothetical protein